VTDKLRVLVADDELIARKRVARLVSSMPGFELVAECASGEEVLERVREDAPDVIVLDIEMPGLTGIDTKALLGPDGPVVIFATAHSEHAVAAFDVDAVDYVLKPVDASRLGRALERAAARVRDRERQPVAEEPEQRRGGGFERLAISTNKGIVLVDPADIGHAVLDGTLVSLHTRTGAMLTEMSLQELGARLPADRFERVHRRAIVNLAMVDRLEPLETGGFIARTKLGGAVEVSRQAARKLRRRLGLA